MRPVRSSYEKQESEDVVRFRIDEVLRDPDAVNLLAEYRSLADAYRSLNRKLFRILFISDVYQADRMSRPTVSTPVSGSSMQDMEDLVQQLESMHPELAKTARNQLNVHRKLQNRLNKLVAISDRFQSLLHRSNKNKDAFIANLSHELRNPLGTVIGITELLRDSELNPAQQELLDILDRAAQNLQQILDDVLDLSRVESGNITLATEHFNLREHLTVLIEQFRYHRYRQNVELELLLDEDLPDTVESDPYRLGQILSNLLSNAMKFTEEGTVRLHVYPQESGLRFDVIDSGIGIEANRIPHLFNRFVQEDGTIEQRFGGTGLGLNIVRNLVQLFRGSVSVESEKGKGSTFSVFLPIRTAQESEAEQAKKKQMLIAEDTPEQRWLIGRFLEDEPVQLTFAETGPEAVAACQEQWFDIVLLDLQIPSLDGFATLNEIRRIYEGRHVPVIAFTGRISEEDQRLTEEAGFDGHLGKPCSREQLKEALRRHLT